MTRGAARLAVAAAIALVYASGEAAARAATRPPEPRRASAQRSGRSADAPAASAQRASPAKRAPSSPPLTSGAAPSGEPGEPPGPTPEDETDPLVGNGLGSPLCKPGLASGGLPATERRHCETSGFVAAPAPTANYGIDVHIDTGVLGISSGGLLSVVQDLFVTPLWMALVWVVHALVVMLEWCFNVDLLGGAAAVGARRGLRQMEAALTAPWLAVVLAVASVLAAYEGMVRRRVAETLGRSLVMAAMMAAGMWVIADPAGTVGALAQWANQASLGTLAVAARGTPAGASGALAQSMDGVFAAAIEAPWCYMEFGDVAWCRDPARLDARLRRAGLRIAADESLAVGCKLAPSPLLACVPAGGPQARAVERSAELLREANSNGAIFLALPANGPARNSINESGSLLRTLCQSSEATHCHGAGAARAEFRTNGGTWSRVGGLLLIAAGVLGMVLLLGFIALRLLAAALFSLLYLLLAPGMVLTPALGEGGRAVFRKWAAQLLGAVLSKLLFSFLLGVILAVLAILSGLEALGWWTQWLLMSAFWWGAYARRHQALGLAHGAFGREQQARPRPLARRLTEALDTPRKAVGLARSRFDRLGGPASDVERSESIVQLARERAKAGTDEQVTRTLNQDHREERARLQQAPAIDRRLSARRSQLERVRRERSKALVAGDTRRAAELLHRGTRIEADIEREQGELNSARQLATEGGRARRRGGSLHTRERVWEREQFLDRQAQLPQALAARGRSAPGAPSDRRDYAALAGLAGYARGEYQRLPPARRRAARLEIDRELALRRELRATARTVESSAAPRIAGRVERKSNRQFDAELARRMRQEGRRMPISREPGRGRPRHLDGESPVMRDAREVAAGRKRQLGRDRP